MSLSVSEARYLLRKTHIVVVRVKGIRGLLYLRKDMVPLMNMNGLQHGDQLVHSRPEVATSATLSLKLATVP